MTPDLPPERFDAYINLVFCVDVSASMRPHLANVRKIVSGWIADLPRMSESKNIPLTDMRARIVPFSPGDAQPLASDFSSVLTPTGRLRGSGLKGTGQFMAQLVERTAIQEFPDGLPRGLEALGQAMMSDWVRHRKAQHVIVLFSASPPDPSIRDISAPVDGATRALPESLDELSDLWHNPPDTWPHRARTFLIVLAPDASLWTAIGDSWERTVFYPTSAGEGLSDLELSTVYEVLLNSWI